MRHLAVVCLLFGLTLGWAQLALAEPENVLFSTDFSRLSPGAFGEFAARGFPEYHHVPRQFTDGWDVVNNRGPAEWKVFEREGLYTLEYLGYNSTEWTKDFTYPMLATGDPLWRDYTLEVQVTPLSRVDWTGVVFQYQDGRHYSLFAFGPGDILTLRYRNGEKAFRTDGWYEMGSTQFRTEPSRKYTLRVESYNGTIRCYVDGQKVFDVSNSRYRGGRIGLLACAPVRFHEVKVITTPAEQAAYEKRKVEGQAELEALRRGNLQPLLWKRIKTSGFGAARSLRLGDLDRDGRLDILLVQNIPFFGSNYNQISCLTALDLDGKMLWQVGTPNPEHAWLSYDVAVQIHDLDGDGQNEVIYAEERWIKVLEGKTGRLKARYPVPESKILPEEASWKEYQHYYRRDHLPFLSVDNFAFCDLRGQGKPFDVIIKDRHTRLWAFTNKFELLWTASANLGHYPYFYDIDKDGHDEVFLGYTVFDHNGKILWSLDDSLEEHADGICTGDFSLSSSTERVFISASDDGVVIADKVGKILKHHRVGHAQTPTIGQYRPDIPGLEFCNINFWGEPGLITLYNSQGEEITRFELIHAGSPILPVNWRGDGVEFILLSGDPVTGGMVDGWGRRVVMFPQDGHPTLACMAHDLIGDARDEIILWDPDWITIYTQSGSFTGERIYAPKRPPAYNESNYAPIVSWPNWKMPPR
jgi:rhamnogalacturonan endolyase